MSGIKDYYNKNFLWIELAASAAMTFLILLYVELAWGRAGMAEFLKGSRQAAYGAFASATVSMLGFVLTAASIILVFGQSPRLEILRQSQKYREIFRIFFQAITWLALGAVWSFIGLLADTDASPRAGITYGAIFFSLVAAARVYRCVWILKEVTDIAVSSSS